jgi:hypothetical protein
MSDFLTRLAARTLGVGSFVQPSLPAVFAGPAGMLGAEPLDESISSAPPEVSNADHERRLPSSSRPTDAQRGSVSRQPRVAGQVETTAPAIGVEQASAAGGSDSTADAASDPRHATAAPAAIARAPLVITNDAPRTARAQAPRAATPGTLPASGGEPLVPSVSDRPARPVGGLLSADVRPSSTTPRPRVSASLRLDALDSAASLGSRTTATPAAAPTVRITIGRVEVRAVTPPDAERPRRRDASETPRMSLSEYLQRRGGAR